jgi:tRNA threonylcarbamoyladenosine biosynthesis protein TsaB
MSSDRASANVLAFDCAGASCACAVLVAGTVAARESAAMERGQAEALLPMIERALAGAAMRFADLDLIAVTVGPGSFTGVRIGLATAHGLALATGLPLIGISSFVAVAAAVGTEERRGLPLAIALESRRAELYLQCFAPDGAARLIAPEEAAAHLPPGPLALAGDGAPRLASWLGARARVVLHAAPPDPADVARVGLASWRPGERPVRPEPLYLRAPDTTLPRRMRAVS